MTVYGAHKITVYVLHYIHRHFKFVGKYWPDDGLLRPKLVANSRITIVVSDGTIYTLCFINVL